MSEALFSEREYLEAQSPEHLAKFVLDHTARIVESERWIGLANEVLEGAYGTTIEAQLDLLNETTQTTGT